MADLVFVYGSLKRGFLHHDQMEGAKFVRDVAISGYFLVLYEGGYPALVQGRAAESDTVSPVQAVSEAHVVHGELYEVDVAHLTRLDEFEECPELYLRRRIKFDDGVSAWTYLIAQEKTSQYPRLEGKWEVPELDSEVSLERE